MELFPCGEASRAFNDRAIARSGCHGDAAMGGMQVCVEVAEEVSRVERRQRLAQSTCMRCHSGGASGEGPTPAPCMHCVVSMCASQGRFRQDTPGCCCLRYVLAAAWVSQTPRLYLSSWALEAWQLWRQDNRPAAPCKSPPEHCRCRGLREWRVPRSAYAAGHAAAPGRAVSLSAAPRRLVKLGWGGKWLFSAHVHNSKHVY